MCINAGTALSAAAVMLLSACSSNSSATSSTVTSGTATSSTATSSTAATGGLNLAAAGCPSTVAIQTDWIPQSEYGYLYEMVGPGYSIDDGQKSVTGPLYVNGKPTGVNIEVLAGGPAIGYQSAASQLAAHRDIFAATIGSDEALQAAKNYKVTAVLAPELRSPASIMWDPATYPKIKSIADLGKADVTVRYGQGETFMNYLLDRGLLHKSQLDGSYNGTPGPFLAAGGKVAEYGYVSNEVYVFQDETSAWDKPLDFQLIADTGYNPYPSQVAVLSSSLKQDTSCLKALVPAMQQGIVSYFKAPSTANGLIVKLNDSYKMGFPYSAGLAAYAAAVQVKDGLSGNSPDGAVGSFDDSREAQQFAIVSGILKETGAAFPAGLKPADFYTNQFIDLSIGM